MVAFVLRQSILSVIFSLLEATTHLMQRSAPDTKSHLESVVTLRSTPRPASAKYCPCGTLLALSLSMLIVCLVLSTSGYRLSLYGTHDRSVRRLLTLKVWTESRNWVETAHRFTARSVEFERPALSIKQMPDISQPSGTSNLAALRLKKSMIQRASSRSLRSPPGIQLL